MGQMDLIETLRIRFDSEQKNLTKQITKNINMKV